ncbi:MAG: GNAT family N-acetyltransferase [Alphaproteobacteria bacterium]|nr:GNAT family N-acetyltransferase [Rhizobiaceae bacterium]MBU3959754.1 GNAT family N-acetyltransferase [Alphaproteobacteria bacterium]MBU4051333.1 GNAT family N-acetyltransferase [Alphaproteobacteria bacterium]MBU4088723.1 GNAT family N-acetyltransferase [Alphaproteobacteria bacterium]MBU4156089.1 GNAT family N-acetyltransferase [Alphaproteobacteria bacterium]
MTIEVLRIDAGFDRYEELLDVILAAFAYMDGRIDPPSSAHRLTPAALRQKAEQEIAFVAIDKGRLVGCVFLKPEESSLYIGKLAVHPAAQGRGIGRLLLAHAEATARKRGLSSLRLETRIELTENHRLFAAWGFGKTAENRHAGYDRTTSIEMRKPLA